MNRCEKSENINRAVRAWNIENWCIQRDDGWAGLCRQPGASRRQARYRLQQLRPQDQRQVQVTSRYLVTRAPDQGIYVVSRIFPVFVQVFRIRILIHRIHMFLGLPAPDPDPLVKGMDPDPSVIKKNRKKSLDSYFFWTFYLGKIM